MFIGWNQWSKLRRFGESRQSFMAAQRELSDNVSGSEKLWFSFQTIQNWLKNIEKGKKLTNKD